MKLKNFVIVSSVLFLSFFLLLWFAMTRHTGIVLLLPFGKIAFTAAWFTGMVMLFVIVVKLPKMLRS